MAGMNTIYMLSRPNWNERFIPMYATSNAGLEKIAREYYHGDQGQAHVEVNMVEMEVRISKGGLVEDVFHIFTVEGIDE